MAAGDLRPNGSVRSRELIRVVRLAQPPNSSNATCARAAWRRPFAAEVAVGDFWLTRLKSRSETPAMSAFRAWLLAGPEVAADAS